MALFLIDRSNDYQTLLEQDLEQAARRQRIELMVFSAENSSSKQVEQVRAAIAGQAMAPPDAILVSPVSEITLVPLVHAAARANIAWVFLNRWNDAIDELRRQYLGAPIFSVSADQDQVGAIHARQVSKLLREGDECVYIQGPLGTSSAKKRLASTQRELAGSGAALTVLHSDWSREGGHAVMTQWLRMLPRASVNGLVVVSQNDSMALGARDALVAWSSNGLNADIIGCDGSPELGQRMVSAGRLAATVVIPAVTSRALDALLAADRGTPPMPELQVAVQSYPSLDTLRSSRS